MTHDFTFAGAVNAMRCWNVLFWDVSFDGAEMGHTRSLCFSFCFVLLFCWMDVVFLRIA